MIAFGPAGAQQVIDASAPGRLLNAWLERRGLCLPKLGERLTPEVENAIAELGTTEDGRSFTAAWSATHGEPVFSRVRVEGNPS